MTVYTIDTATATYKEIQQAVIYLRDRKRVIASHIKANVKRAELVEIYNTAIASIAAKETVSTPAAPVAPTAPAAPVTWQGLLAAHRQKESKVKKSTYRILTARGFAAAARYANRTA